MAKGKKTGGRKATSATLEYRRAHRKNAWARARRAETRWRSMQSRYAKREDVNSAMEQYRTTMVARVARWAADDLATSLAPFAEKPVRLWHTPLAEATSRLLEVLRERPFPQESMPAVPLPADAEDWPYEDSINRASAVRLEAMAHIHEVTEAITAGDVVDIDTTQARFNEYLQPVVAALHAIPWRFTAEPRQPPAMAGAIEKELQRVLEGPWVVRKTGGNNG